GEGLTLPWVTRALGLAHTGRHERQEERNEEFRARRRALEATIIALERLTREREAPESVVRPIRVAHSDRLKLVDHRSDGDARHKKLVNLGDEIEIALIEAERDFVNDLYRDGELKDESRRHIERELDLRDASLANLRSTE
ncbi:MAG TPA: Na+/H+ antiporter, partial [Roseiarcus sp.]